eukprot:352715-Chlamydomonas_euryale.AAC.4
MKGCGMPCSDSLVRLHNGILRPIGKRHNGREVSAVAGHVQIAHPGHAGMCSVWVEHPSCAYANVTATRCFERLGQGSCSREKGAKAAHRKRPNSRMHARGRWRDRVGAHGQHQREHACGKQPIAIHRPTSHDRPICCGNSDRPQMTGPFAAASPHSLCNTPLTINYVSRPACFHPAAL